MPEAFYWGPFVGIDTVSDEVCNELLKRAYKVKETGENAAHHLAGHFKTEYYFTKDDKKYFIENTNHIWDNYIKRSKLHYSKDLCKNGLKLDSLWVNFMGPNDFNPIHTHNGHLSFVLYLDVPKELETENINEKNNDVFGGPGCITFLWGDTGSTMAITQNTRLPKTKEMYIFPASTRHMVYPYKSNVTRISMSGNLFFRD